MYATRDIAEGEELLISYGSHPNAQVRTHIDRQLCACRLSGACGVNSWVSIVVLGACGGQLVDVRPMNTSYRQLLHTYGFVDERNPNVSVFIPTELVVNGVKRMNAMQEQVGSSQTGVRVRGAKAWSHTHAHTPVHTLTRARIFCGSTSHTHLIAPLNVPTVAVSRSACGIFFPATATDR